MMGFIYNEDRDIFIHMPSHFVLAGDYLLVANNSEIKNKFYDATGKVLDDFSIGVMRTRIRNGQTV